MNYMCTITSLSNPCFSNSRVQVDASHWRGTTPFCPSRGLTQSSSSDSCLHVNNSNVTSRCHLISPYQTVLLTFWPIHWAIFNDDEPGDKTERCSDHDRQQQLTVDIRRRTAAIHHRAETWRTMTLDWSTTWWTGREIGTGVGQRRWHRISQYPAVYFWLHNTVNTNAQCRLKTAYKLLTIYLICWNNFSIKVNADNAKLIFVLKNRSLFC